MRRIDSFKNLRAVLQQVSRALQLVRGTNCFTSTAGCTDAKNKEMLLRMTLRDWLLMAFRITPCPKCGLAASILSCRDDRITSLRYFRFPLQIRPYCPRTSSIPISLNLAFAHLEGNNIILE
jgi:hypothetical protein